MNEHVLSMMRRKSITPQELRAAQSDLEELKEEHGEALDIVMLFEEEAIKDTVGAIESDQQESE